MFNLCGCKALGEHLKSAQQLENLSTLKKLCISVCLNLLQLYIKFFKCQHRQKETVFKKIHLV